MRYLLVDRIDSVEPGVKATGRKNAAMSEDVLEWHFPGQPIFPGTLVLEAMVQLAGWLEAASSDFQRWVLLDRVTSARFFGFAGPGDRIDLVVEQVASADPQRRAYRAESTVGGERRSSVDFEVVVVAVGVLDDVERVRRTFATLRGAPAPGTPKR